MGSDALEFDLERDHHVTDEDMRAQRELRLSVPSWFTLSPRELAALLPPDALRRRPPTPATIPPFTLEWSGAPSGSPGHRGAAPDRPTAASHQQQHGHQQQSGDGHGYDDVFGPPRRNGTRRDRGASPQPCGHQ